MNMKIYGKPWKERSYCVDEKMIIPLVNNWW